jgi:hypothetical protein
MFPAFKHRLSTRYPNIQQPVVVQIGEPRPGLTPLHPRADHQNRVAYADRPDISVTVRLWPPIEEIIGYAFRCVVSKHHSSPGEQPFVK